ncbi:MAG: DUF503 domain-containing protein [Lachnospiraceae bacterium]|nr:DUF503 domain-containing protein [Lachnospiraceae bacterium]
MIIGTCIIDLSIPWSESLKDKRMVVKSLLSKITNKFNISAAEVDNQDILKTATIGIACVSNEKAHANSVIDNVIDFIELNTEAVLQGITVEII